MATSKFQNFIFGVFLLILAFWLISITIIKITCRNNPIPHQDINISTFIYQVSHLHSQSMYCLYLISSTETKAYELFLKVGICKQQQWHRSYIALDSNVSVNDPSSCTPALLCLFHGIWRVWCVVVDCFMYIYLNLSCLFLNILSIIELTTFFFKIVPVLCHSHTEIIF